MNKYIEWVKANKLTTLLLIIVGYFLFGGFASNLLGSSARYDKSYMSSSTQFGTSNSFLGMDMMETDYEERSMPSPIPPIDDYAPVIDQTPRKVITNTYVSLLVKDVRDVADKISTEAEKRGGYFVNKYVSTPFEGGAGSISIRIPLEERDGMMNFLRENSVKVVDENVDASDITDQYEDLDAQLAQLEKTLSRFNTIYDQAETITEILSVQSQISSIQRQIDSVKGRMKALDAKSKTTLISISLSTDELALPYSPGQPWRPNVIFKQAVRQLNMDLRGIGEFAIYIGVYAILWIPAIVVIILGRKAWKKRSLNK